MAHSTASPYQRKNHYLPLVAIFLLGFGLRVYRLDEQGLWWDEIYTVARAAMSVPELIENLFESRVHLPLYFMLTQVWSEIGRSSFIIRYFSVVMGVLTLPLMYASGRLLAGRKVGLLAAFLLAISPFHVWYSQEARMYTFLAFNALAANYFLLRLFRQESRRDWIGYAVTLTLTMYSHYLGALLLIAHYVFFSLHYRHDKVRFKHWFMSAFVAGALFSAWFLAVFFISSFTQASISWIAPVRWFEPLVTLLAFASGRTIDPQRPFYYLPFFAYLLATLVSLPYLRRTNTITFHHLAARLLWSWLFVPLALLTLISLDWSIPDQRFVYMDRYIISLLPAFVLLAAWGVVGITQQQKARRWLVFVFLGLVLAPTLLSLRNLYNDPTYGREEWRTAVAHMTTQQQSGDLLLLTPGQILPLAYYENQQLARLVLPTDPTELPGILPAIQQDHKRAWFIESFDNANTHGFPQARNEAVISAPPDDYAAWLGQQFTPIATWQFPGIRLSLYNLHPAEE
jgi:uncharacterized membrane protein